MTKLQIREKIKNISRIIPKMVTFILLRILLIFPMGIFLYRQEMDLAAGFFVGIAVLGYISIFFFRNKDEGRQLVSILDPLSDKLLILVASFLLWRVNKLQSVVFVIYALKDISMLVGGLGILIGNIKTIFRRNNLDKWTQFSQFLALFLIMIGVKDYIIIWFSVALTLISGIYSVFRSGVIFTKKRTDLERIKFSSLIELPDYITFINVIAGLFSIALSTQGNYFWAMIMLLIAVIADFLDGKVARKMNREGNFGKELDSLADTVSFGVAPAIFGFSIIQNNALASIAFTVFLLCGILRLAKYNVTENQGEYEGLPITMNGIIIPLIFFFNMPLDFYPYVYLVLGILMVSPIGVKKL